MAQVALGTQVLLSVHKKRTVKFVIKHKWLYLRLFDVCWNPDTFDTYNKLSNLDWLINLQSSTFWPFPVWQPEGIPNPFYFIFIYLLNFLFCVAKTFIGRLAAFVAVHFEILTLLHIFHFSVWNSLKMGHSQSLFSLISSFQRLTAKMLLIKFYRWLDLNRGPLVLEAPLQIEPQPLPKSFWIS